MPFMLAADLVDKAMGSAPEDYLSRQLQTDPKIFGDSYLRGKLSSDTRIEAGMVLRVKRRGYRHYGVYVGGGRMIHYTSNAGERSKHCTIQETSLTRFIGGSDVVDVVGFPDAIEGKKCLSRAEAVANARSRLGEGGYKVLSNNCQHFAIWCRTGIKFSGQSSFVKPSASVYNALPHAPDLLGIKGMSIVRSILSSQVIAG